MHFNIINNKLFYVKDQSLNKYIVYPNSSKLACRIASSGSGASDIWFALRERRIAVQNTKMKDTRAGEGDDSVPIAMSR